MLVSLQKIALMDRAIDFDKIPGFPKIALAYHTVKIDLKTFYDPTDQSHINMIASQYYDMKLLPSNDMLLQFGESLIHAFGNEYFKQVLDAVEKNHIQHSIDSYSNDCIQIHITI